MSLITIDLAGSIDPDFGIGQDQLIGIAPTMDQLRDDFLAEVDRSENHFFNLPMQQYLAYQDTRSASPLGRVFDVGTGLYDHVDAVVVVGSAEATAAARGIFRSCCDPYHNELSRADRGSRPRMYFAGDTFDNDDLAALLHRLSQCDFRDSPAESRWALLMMDSASGHAGQADDGARLAFQALLRELPEPTRFLFAVATADSWLDQQSKALGCENVFALPPGSSSSELTLSASSLLPSAMLGLDCIKLLEGAVMMNDHFKSAAAGENVVLQFVAIHELLARRDGVTGGGITGRSLRAWPSALGWLPTWYQSIRGSHFCDVTHDSSVTTNWIAQKPRYDPLEFGEDMFADSRRTLRGRLESGPPAERAATMIDRSGANDGAARGHGGSFAAKMAEVMDTTHQADRAAGKPTVTIRLPTIDMRVLGQIFQMLMIATKLEAQFK